MNRTLATVLAVTAFGMLVYDTIVIYKLAKAAQQAEGTVDSVTGFARRLGLPV